WHEMRQLFLVLLLLNMVLFGWLRGWFGESVSGREPGRVDQQIAAERIRVLNEQEVQQIERRARDAKAAPAPMAAAATDSTVACLEIGEFANDAQLARLRDKLTALKLTDRASEQTRDRPGWYLVYLPAERTFADAEQRTEQLRAQGLQDLLIFKEGTLRFAIGIGSFRDRDLARKQVALLDRRGIRGARITDNPTTVRSTRVLIRGADAAAVRQLQDAAKDFPQQKMQPCSETP
ncbi:MAG TPA: SPOR domain-containing protein, partial [Burkholderiaceae bacterium]